MRGLHPQVALFSENGARWLVADQGIMMAGGARLPSVEAPRCWVTALS
jgi:long-subunit acyl-CoA synthetase (AMP-forming)